MGIISPGKNRKFWKEKHFSYSLISWNLQKKQWLLMKLTSGLAACSLSWFFPDFFKLSWFSWFWLKFLILSWFFVIYSYRSKFSQLWSVAAHSGVPRWKLLGVDNFFHKFSQIFEIFSKSLKFFFEVFEKFSEFV